MPHQTMQEILAALDAQQRREIAALAGLVEDAELKRARNAKRQLYAASAFFIERTWEVIAPQLRAFSLEAEAAKSTPQIQAHLHTLQARGPAFAWGWLRARMNACLMRHLDACVPDLLAEYPQQAALYVDSLHSVDAYWFRQSPPQHLKAGYHTALAVACKWYGSALELLLGPEASCPPAVCQFRGELRQFASFSMTMLERTDGYLWDSAGAEPLDAVIEEGTLKIGMRAIEELSLANAPDYGVRLGCPALRARSEAGPPAFDGVITWMEQVFSKYLLE